MPQFVGVGVNDPQGEDLGGPHRQDDTETQQLPDFVEESVAIDRLRPRFHRRNLHPRRRTPLDLQAVLRRPTPILPAAAVPGRLPRRLGRGSGVPCGSGRLCGRGLFPRRSHLAFDDFALPLAGTDTEPAGEVRVGHGWVEVKSFAVLPHGPLDFAGAKQELGVDHVSLRRRVGLLQQGFDDNQGLAVLVLQGKRAGQADLEKRVGRSGGQATGGGVGCAAGLGFTVALFFATAAFPPGPMLDQAKLGALFSVSAAVVTLVAALALRVGRFATASPAARL